MSSKKKSIIFLVLAIAVLIVNFTLAFFVDNMEQLETIFIVMAAGLSAAAVVAWMQHRKSHPGGL